MKLVADYFSGTLKGYSKERVLGEVGPTTSVAVNWRANWGKIGLPLIDLRIPEWGVMGIIASNNRKFCGISLVPDNTDILIRLVANSSGDVSERLIGRNNGQILYFKKPIDPSSRRSMERFPHIIVKGNLANVCVEGPNDNGVLRFTSKLKFSFQE